MCMLVDIEMFKSVDKVSILRLNVMFCSLVFIKEILGFWNLKMVRFSMMVIIVSNI